MPTQSRATRPRVVAERRVRRVLGLYPVEIIVGAFAVLTLALANARDASLFHPVGLYRERVVSMLPLYATGLLLSLLVLRLRMISAYQKVSPERLPFHVTWRVFRETSLNRYALLRDVRILHALVLTFVVFISLKHLIPVISKRNFDESLLNLELRWFSGRLLGEWFIYVFSPGAAPVLSEIYFLFYPYVAALIFIFLLQRNELLTHEFALGFALVWLLGILIVYALPTWGPIFVTPEVFQDLPATGVSHMQQTLWDSKLIHDSKPGNGEVPFLISGFPSLHFAVLVFGSLALWNLNAWWSAASWLLALGTFVATLYFGWHYLLDDVGGLVLALVARRLARRTFQLRYLILQDPVS